MTEPHHNGRPARTFTARNVVIAGGGFAGFHAARTLEGILRPAAARVTLVNDANVNDSPYGLSASVFSADVSRAEALARRPYPGQYQALRI